MQSFYLKSDLDSLISELSKYNSVEAVMQFIDDLDKFIVLEELRKDKMPDEKKNQLMTMMSAPLTFFNKEYVFDMNSQFGTSSRTI